MYTNFLYLFKILRKCSVPIFVIQSLATAAYALPGSNSNIEPLWKTRLSGIVSRIEYDSNASSLKLILRVQCRNGKALSGNESQEDTIYVAANTILRKEVRSQKLAAASADLVPGSRIEATGSSIHRVPHFRTYMNIWAEPFNPADSILLLEPRKGKGVYKVGRL